MEKTTYIIWKNQEDRNVRDVNEVVGLFYGTYLEADDLIEKLGEEDLSVVEGLFGKKLYPYWRSSPPTITEKNWREFLPS